MVSNAGSERHFAQTYAEARRKFLAAAASASASLRSYPHPLRGREGEELAVDAALLGDADAPSLLMITSGCHGVEGFCGSGAQVTLLCDAAWHEAASRAGVAVLYLHGQNPHGFSWGRRTTEDNVDLNRNFHDFGAPLPANEGYRELAGALVPASWPPSPEAAQVIGGFMARHGLRGLQAAVSGGQYEHADGLFYGGRAPTWSNLTLRRQLREYASHRRRLAWIDLHSGLGALGECEKIFHGRPDDAANLARARAWWGPEVTSIYDGSSSSALLSGMSHGAIYEECPGVEYTGIALENGTLPMFDVLEAMRGDQWLHNHPGAADADRRRAIERRMRDAFYVDDAAWKRRVAANARAAAEQALAGMADLPQSRSPSDS